MEADWEYELGVDAPVVDVHWNGYVDLRKSPQRAIELTEAAGLPALAAALIRLNEAHTHLFTSKCDVWRVPDATDLDPDELDASHSAIVAAVACYIDLLPEPDGWPAPHHAEQWCRSLCSDLRARTLHQCRVDLIVREAALAHRQPALAVTAYITAGGSTSEAAKDVLSAALSLFAQTISDAAIPKQRHQSYNEHTGE